MKLMLILIPVLLAALVLTSRPASACLCGPPPTATGSLLRSHAVFTGRVMRIGGNPLAEEMGWEQGVQFEVSEAWKGVESRRVVLVAGSSGGPCGFEFAEGLDYLVYAYRDSGDPNGRLSTTSCTRTSRLAFAQRDLRELGPPAVLFTPESNDAGRWWIVGTIAGALLLSVAIPLLVTWRLFRRRSAL